MLKNTVLLILIVFSSNCSVQTLLSIKKIEKTHQDCLDRGGYMKGCAQEYYRQSLQTLDIVYAKYYKQLSKSQQSKLKKEQSEWNKKRDKEFEKQYSDLKKEGLFDEGSRDFDMIIYDKRTDFNFKRVRELIKRMD